MDIRYEELFSPKKQDIEDINTILSHLSPKAPPTSWSAISNMVATCNAKIYIARDSDRIIGMATLFEIDGFTGRFGIIKDVVVKISHRYRGIGTTLLKMIVEENQRSGLARMEILSHPLRTDFNKACEEAGFTRKDDCVYRIDFEK